MPDGAPTYSEVLPPDTFCPGCIEDATGTPALGTSLAYCYQHAPSMSGVDDAAVPLPGLSAHSNEADGGDCRAVQAIIR